MSRLTGEEVLKIRRSASNGISDERLAILYAVSVRTIRDCRLGIRYCKTGGPITKRNIHIPDAIIRQIRTMASDKNILLKDIAAQYKVSAGYVGEVARGAYRKSACGILSGPRHKHFCVNTEI